MELTTIKNVTGIRTSIRTRNTLEERDSLFIMRFFCTKNKKKSTQILYKHAKIPQLDTLTTLSYNHKIFTIALR